jgi:dTDP-4-amino-4,6-dideoxygalactose transaminase
LHLALIAAGVGPGDEVITVPHTFVATVAAILYIGARPVFVDIDPASYTMDAGAVERAITKRTRAIMPVHLYGQPADMDPILEVGRRRDIPVVEDAAQAHGAEYRGRRCGSLGLAAGFSFYPGKNLGAMGEGGAITTNSDAIRRTVGMLRDWGQEKRYHHVMKGFNARLEAVQGAVLRVKLRYLEGWTEARRAHAAAYRQMLQQVERIVLPAEFPDRRHVYHIYAVRVANRDAFIGYLSERGVHTGIHYPVPVHRLEGYRDLGYGAGSFPISEKVASEVVSLPMYPEMTAAHVERVAEVVAEWAHS